MKKFKEIEGYGAIRCEAKISTDKLTTLHYQVNDIIFKYNMQYAFSHNVEQAINQLTRAFVTIKNLDVKDAAKPKKEELLSKGRYIVKSLVQYLRGFKYDESCILAIESMCKYQVSKYLKQRSNLTIEDGVTILEDNEYLKLIVDDITKLFNVKLKVTSFEKMQEEIIGILCKKIKEYTFVMPPVSENFRLV